MDLLSVSLLKVNQTLSYATLFVFICCFLDRSSWMWLIFYCILLFQTVLVLSNTSPCDQVWSSQALCNFSYISLALFWSLMQNLEGIILLNILVSIFMTHSTNTPLFTSWLLGTHWMDWVSLCFMVWATLQASSRSHNFCDRPHA